MRPGRTIGLVATAIAAAAVLVGVITADPVARFETFKRVPGETTIDPGDFVQAHLLSGNGRRAYHVETAESHSPHGVGVSPPAP